MKKIVGILIFCLALLAGTATAKADYAGGDGGALEVAVIINEPNELAGVEAEAAWINQNHPGWKKGKQILFQKEGKSYDRIEYTTPEGETKTIYYDITSFFGKF